jgi:PilZ domain-containing protein
MTDRRKAQRSRTYFKGQITFNNRYATLDCFVRNMSEEGAKIVFADTVPIPAEFDVMIRGKSESKRASMIWRNETEAGVAFFPWRQPTIISIDAARRLRSLETERDALARRVAQLSDPA